MRVSRVLVGLIGALLAGPAIAQEAFTYSYNGYSAELPVKPQRVFVMDSRTGLDFAVSAGFPIVATDWDADVGSHFERDLPVGTDKLAFRGEPNAELVLTYDPDLLVVGKGWWTYWQDQAMFRADKFPVLVVEDANGADWRQLFLNQMTANAPSPCALWREDDPLPNDFVLVPWWGSWAWPLMLGTTFLPPALAARGGNVRALGRRWPRARAALER